MCVPENRDSDLKSYAAIMILIQHQFHWQQEFKLVAGGLNHLELKPEARRL